MDNYNFDFETYSKEAYKHFKSILTNNANDEKVFQEFFERNVSFIPGAHSAFGQNTSGHDPIHNCLISQPKIRGLNTRVPDFMWLSYDSSVFSPVLIEIEAPNKKYFKRDGSPTQKFSQAKDQLDEWCAQLSIPQNILNFYEDFDIDLSTRRLVFEPYYLLIYGRREEFEGDEILTRKRRTLLDKSRQQILMSFDRLRPNKIVSEFSCCYVKERKLKLVALGQATKLDWFSEHLIHFENVNEGIEQMMFTPESRKTYLKGNFENHVKELKREK